jgi:hypothetical protein
MSDILRIALIFGVAAMAITVICLGYFTWQNAGSRNLGLAYATLFAAMILFVVQLSFELRAEENAEFITAEFTINREKPEIRTWSYQHTSHLRLDQDIDASRKFAAAHPGQLDGDREKLTKDMVVFSLLAYLGVEHPDWQMKRTKFIGQISGTVTLASLGSKPAECKRYTKDELRTILEKTGNTFADGDLFFGSQVLCLPPRSSLRVSTDGLILSNPFCKISFVLEGAGNVWYMVPGVDDPPLLANGEPKFETRLVGIRVTTRYSAIRAQHRDMPKYKDWAERVVKGAENWFMESPSG